MFRGVVHERARPFIFGMKGMVNKAKPENLVFETRLDSVRLSIWLNRDNDGRRYHSVKVIRRFKAGPDEWSDSNHYTGLGQVALLKQAATIAEQFLISAEIND